MAVCSPHLLQMLLSTYEAYEVQQSATFKKFIAKEVGCKVIQCML